MVLSARILTNVGSVNAYDYAQVQEMTEGDTVDVYFQLIDKSMDRVDQGFKQSGRRFMPAAGAVVTAVVDNIDTARQISRACTQPFSNDLSIWRLSIMSSDIIKGTSNLKLTVVEGGRTWKCLVPNAIRAYPNSNV